MKTIYKNSIQVALSASICLLLAMPASAQRPATNGGSSGSSSRPSAPSTSSAPQSRPAPSNGGSFQRPSNNSSFQRPSGNSGFQRPSGNTSFQRPQQNNTVQRSGFAPRGPVYVDRQGNVLRGGNTPQTQRGNYGYAPRTGFAPQTNAVGRPGANPRGATSGGLSYRTSPQVGYGHGSGGYWGNHGYYHYSHGYYNSYYAPRLGFSLGVLPYGYYPFYFGDYQYFYSDGLYYSYDNDQYTVVEPPIGAEITVLPDKAQSIMINGQQYYELNGVYYQPVTKDDGTITYQIAGKDGQLNTNSSVQDQAQQGPQMGDIVDQLPSDCRKIKVNGTKLFVSPDGVYYQQQVDANGGTTYKIVGLPSDEPEQN